MKDIYQNNIKLEFIGITTYTCVITYTLTGIIQNTGQYNRQHQTLPNNKTKRTYRYTNKDKQRTHGRDSLFDWVQKQNVEGLNHFTCAQTYPFYYLECITYLSLKKVHS